MKTLDEVIKALRICDETVTANCPDCPYDLDCENVPGEDLRADALHYLKEYRSDKLRWEADRKNWNDNYAVKLAQLEDATAKHITALKKLNIGMLNDPLTWDELKQMEGKPVWVESHGDITEFTGWAIVKDIRPEDRVNFILSKYEGDGFYALEIGVLKAMMGIEWQAYRKERK